MTMGMGFPMGMGTDDKIGNGREWETTCMGMGMALILMGINSHWLMQYLVYAIVTYSLLYNTGSV